MKVKALVSFGGVVSMAIGEEREIQNEEVLKDLLNAGYVIATETPKKKRTDKNENQ